MTPGASRLKLGVRASIDRAGGIDRGADVVGRKRSWVGDWNNLNTDAFPPVDAAAKLDAVAVAQGDLPPITLAMARENGCALIRLPEARDADGNWLGLVGALSSEASDVINGICAALADGRIDKGEAKRLRAEVAQGQQIFADIDAALASIEGGE